MIKEYIENLPGGKEYISAQRSLGGVIGAILMFIGTVFLASTTYGEIGSNYTKDGVILIMLVMSGFFVVLISVIGLIKYYYTINKADNMYINKIEEIRK